MRVMKIEDDGKTVKFGIIIHDNPASFNVRVEWDRDGDSTTTYTSERRVDVTEIDAPTETLLKANLERHYRRVGREYTFTVTVNYRHGAMANYRKCTRKVKAASDTEAIEKLREALTLHFCTTTIYFGYSFARAV